MKDRNFEEIYEAYFSRVYRYALRLCRSESEAEELTSDTFFRALNAIEDFRGDCDIFTWLCGIAKNRYLSEMRKEKPTGELDERAAAEFSTAELLEDADTAMRLHERLHVLSEPYKEVFTLRVFGELSFGQIARIFSKNENWACVTYHRARKKLMEQITDE